MGCFASHVALCAGDMESYVVSVGAERTQELATGPCKDKTAGDSCTDTGYAKGICSLEKASANAQAQLTCKAMECVENRYLWIAENGTQMGRCHRYDWIQKNVCDKNAGKCTNGKKFTPHIIPNPNNGYGGLAYQGCLCQPDCEGVYGEGTEAYKCCILGAVWDKTKNTCDCSKMSVDRTDLEWTGETCKIKKTNVDKLRQREIILPKPEGGIKSISVEIS